MYSLEWQVLCQWCSWHAWGHSEGPAQAWKVGSPCCQPLLEPLEVHKAKLKVLHQSNSWYQHRLEDEEIETRPAKTYLGVLEDEKNGHKLVLAAQKPNCILGYRTRRVVNRPREETGECCIQLSKDLLGKVQRRSRTMNRGLEHPSNEGRVGELW